MLIPKPDTFAAAPVSTDPAECWLAQARRAQAVVDLPAGLAAALAAAQSRPNPHQAIEAGLLACHFHYRLGQFDPLIALGEPLQAGLQQDGWQAERRELIQALTLAAADTGRFDLAMTWAAEACNLAEAASDAGQQALALGLMAACFERMGDPWQAERLMRVALAHAERCGAGQPLALTLNDLATVALGGYHLLRDLTPDEAAALLGRAEDCARRAQTLWPQGTDPFFALQTAGNLAEVLVHRGALAEAGPVLAEALALALKHRHGALVWRLQCIRAESLIRCDRAAEARDLLHQVDADAGAALPMSTRFRLHQTLYRACRSLGQVDKALAQLERYEQLQRERGARQLRAQSVQLVTRVEADHERQAARIARAHAALMTVHAGQDALTGLGNRRHLDSHLPRLLAATRARPLALAMVDIDSFKLINDRHGHLCGDRVLVAVAQLLRENTRSADLLARIGGEEFIIVLPDMPPERALEACERLRERICNHPWSPLAEGLDVTVSIGLTSAPPYEATVLYDRADRALYHAKQGGRNRVQAFSPV